jgi:hypothetical protein
MFSDDQSEKSSSESLEVKPKRKMKAQKPESANDNAEHDKASKESKIITQKESKRRKITAKRREKENLNEETPQVVI